MVQLYEFLTVDIRLLMFKDISFFKIFLVTVLWKCWTVNNVQLHVWF